MSPSLLTIHEAAVTTGWSARMLRYVEQLGLVTPERSPAGYRLYGPAQLRRLRTLRELLARHGATLADLGFALRVEREPQLAADLRAWFGAEPERSPAHTLAAVGAPRPGGADWLAFEQTKHEQLLAPQHPAATSRSEYA